MKPRSLKSRSKTRSKIQCGFGSPFWWMLVDFLHIDLHLCLDYLQGISRKQVLVSWVVVSVQCLSLSCFYFYIMCSISNEDVFLFLLQIRIPISIVCAVCALFVHSDA